MPYHVNEKGEPGLCKAEVQCPFGNADEHYESASDARAAYERSMADVPELVFKAYNKDVVSELANTTDLEAPPTEEELALAPEDPANPAPVPADFDGLSHREVEDIIDEQWSEEAAAYEDQTGRRMPMIDYTEYWRDRDENGPIENLHPDATSSRSDW